MISEVRPQITQPIQRKSPVMKHRLSFMQQNSNLSSIQQIYKSSKQLITDIDNRISKSQHKTEIINLSKYQHTIKFQENQIIRLKKRLKLQEMITNPTKDYINDVLNQLITLKRQNEILKNQLLESKHTTSLLKSVVKTNKKKGKSLAKNAVKQNIQKLPSVHVSEVKQIIDKYFLQKSSDVKIQTKLDAFLKSIRKIPVTMNKLLVEIDKWIQNQNFKLVPHTVRLRYHLNNKSSLKRSDVKANSVDRREQSDFERFVMPTEEQCYSARKLVRKRGEI